MLISLSLLLSLVFVLSSLLTQSQLELLWGHQNNVPLYINLFSYIGILVGILITSEFGKKATISLLFVAGVGALLFGVYYSEVLLSGAQGGVSRYILALLFFCLLILIGYFQQKIFYLNQKFEIRYYSLIHILMTVLIPCLLFLIRAAGVNVLISILGLVLLAIAANILRNQRKFKFIKSQIADKVNFNSVSWGLCSSVYIGIFFELANQIYRPTGIEYPVYLVTVFLALSLSPITIKYFSSTKKLFLGVQVTVLLLFVILSACEILPIYKIFNLDFTMKYSSVILTAILLIPYFLFAAIIPLKEKLLHPGAHLLSCVLGNIFGILTYIIFLKDFDLSYQVIFLMLCLCFLLSQEKSFRYKGLSYAISISFMTALFFVSLDKRISAFSLQYLANYKGEIKFDLFLRKAGHIGYLTTNPQTQRRHLGLGGYHVKYDSLKEIQQVLWMNEVRNIGFEKALVIGLGGHQALATLIHLNDVKNIKSWRIDIVDNNPIFNDLGFRETLANDSRMTWNDERLNLTIEDAFTYVFRNKKKYDVIIWNLSWPIADSTGKLYTSEFVKKLHEQLTPSGVMVGYIDNVFFNQEKLYCLFQSGSENFIYLPGLAANIVWISSKMPLNLNAKYAVEFFQCKDVKVPNLEHPYSEVVLSLDILLYSTNASFYRSKILNSPWSSSRADEIPFPLRLTRDSIFNEKRDKDQLLLNETRYGRVLEERISDLVRK